MFARTCLTAGALAVAGACGPGEGAAGVPDGEAGSTGFPATTIGSDASTGGDGGTSVGPATAGSTTHDPGTSTATESGSSTGAGTGVAEDWVVLFDGELTDAWQMSTIIDQPGQDDPGEFVVVDGVLESRPGTDLGLLWNSDPTPSNFVLALEWRRTAEDDNSGVFVRFPDPRGLDYDNTAWVAIEFGFEIQIDETGAPDGEAVHRTGAIYGESEQDLWPVAGKPVGEWNEYEIRVEDQSYTVALNGETVSVFDNPHRGRGLPTMPDAPSFIGLQAHTGHVQFRDIRIRASPSGR